MLRIFTFLILVLGYSLVGATETIPLATTDIFPLQWGHAIFLLIVGLVGGLISGFIGSSGAFILTPAMMIIGVPAIVAVASNICHKFPKALVSALKRIRHGLVDIKLAIVIGISAEIGILCGAYLQVYIRNNFGSTSSNIYVAIIFLLVLTILAIYNFRDAKKIFKTGEADLFKRSALSHKVRSINIPGTMMYFPSLETSISVLFTIPIGFFTGLLAANIAVGSFISVPAMIYVLGAGGLMASATQLLIAFIIGIGGTIQYGISGFVDIRLAMIILSGSLLGVHLGAIAATYAKDYLPRLITGILMVIILFSLATKMVVYLHDASYLNLVPETVTTLNYVSFNLLNLALLVGTIIILYTVIIGTIKYNKAQRFMEEELALSPHLSEINENYAMSATQLSPTGRFEKILLVTDRSEATVGATSEAIRLAQRSDGKLIAMSVVMMNPEHASLAKQLIEKENTDTLSHLEKVRTEANKAGVTCDISVRHGIEIYQEIINEAEQNHVDVIVMGRRGMTGLMRLMMGSNTAKVIGYSQCSVLIVPRTAIINGSKILLAVDGSRYSDIAASATMSIAKHMHAPVLVVSVVYSDLKEKRYTEAVQEIKRVETFLTKEGIEVQGEVLSGNPAEVLIEIADAKGVDLIVMGSHGRTGLDRVMLGSVSDRVIGHANCAVLVVKL